MIRRFDGSRLGSSRSAAAYRPYPDIGLHSMTGRAIVKDALPGALHRALRAATRSDHVEVDRFVGRLNFNSRKEYGCFLTLHYCALQNLSGDWRAEDSEDFSKMLKCLQCDLQALGPTRIKLHPRTRHPLVFGNRLGVG